MAYEKVDLGDRNDWRQIKSSAGNNDTGLKSLLLGLGLGAVGMFFLDPQRGRRRRALVRDKLIKYGHEVEWYVGKNYRNFRNHLKGWRAERRRKYKMQNKPKTRHIDFDDMTYN